MIGGLKMIRKKVVLNRGEVATLWLFLHNPGDPNIDKHSFLTIRRKINNAAR